MSITLKRFPRQSPLDSLTQALGLLRDRGPLTLDDLVQHLGGGGGRAQAAGRKDRALRRELYAQLRADGPMVREGLVSVDIKGRYIVSEKGVQRASLAVAADPASESASATAPARRRRDRPALRRYGRVGAWLADHLPAPMAPWMRWVCGTAAFTAATAGVVGYRELRRSDAQSWYASNFARTLTFDVASGPSDAIRFPSHGPFDERLGYSKLPTLLDRTVGKGYRLASQARLSPAHIDWMDRGFYAIYREKAQAGLTVLDQTGKPIFESLYPQLIYDEFASIPDVIVRTLLFIENRELLDERYPFKNPVIEWDRLGLAVTDMLISKIVPGHDVPGGSTLATQIEKYRHSPEGRTSGMTAKAIQMASATMRAYSEGRDTAGARRRIVTDYINSVPLGAIPGAGEVRGLGHGLVAWHGARFAAVNELLRDVATPEADPDRLKAKARAYKEVLSLFLAQRRPAFYLQSNREALKGLTQKHLGPLERAGILTPEFRRAVDGAELSFRNDRLTFQPERLSFVERKAANAVRVHLMQLFGFDRLYTLDRLDLKVTSTIDYDTQAEVTKVLQKLKDPAFAEAAELRQHRLLAQGDPKDVVYSFTLRERVGDTNVLRVQADNVDGPFNVSEGGKLELGSTAKLRTLVTYLEIVEDLWRQYASMPASERAKVKPHPMDRLTQWALAYVAGLGDADDRGLPAMLDAAMARPYSANPDETFFTGGGAHRFGNFQKEDDARVVDVSEALRKSINLPFVRMMRELVYYNIGQIPGSVSMLQDATDPLRRQYLTRFANKEGKDFLGRFYLRYRGQPPAAVLKAFLSKRTLTARRLAAVYSVVKPEGDLEGFRDFARAHLPQVAKASPKLLESAFNDLKNGAYTLQDLGVLAGAHPLELWLVAHMYRTPDANFSQIMEASIDRRQEAYRWLFNSKSKDKQDLRIRIMLEQEAFQAIHKRWKAVGYPFGHLVPTYATALGSSGDRPAALAELMGVIAAGGVRYSSSRVDEMHFAQGTPFETRLTAAPVAGERVLSQEVAAVLQSSLRSVVEEGTAQRVKGAFTLPGGQVLAVGGKTGTGDNRYAVYAPGGRVIESKVMSRTATFVFSIGDRFFGTLTAYVPNANAGRYNFTSALPVQILKVLAPKLAPLLGRTTVAAAPEPERGDESDAVAL